MAEPICELAKEHIGILADINARLKSVENKVDDISDMKENLKLLTYLQQRQEERDIKFDKIYEEQIKTNSEVTSALKNINTNLDNLNHEIKKTNDKVDGLESKLQKAEELNKVDIRENQRESIKLSLGQKAKKAVIPVGAISGVIVGLYEIFKTLKEAGIIK